jgi:hypothetical protein
VNPVKINQAVVKRCSSSSEAKTFGNEIQSTSENQTVVGVRIESYAGASENRTI